MISLNLTICVFLRLLGACMVAHLWGRRLDFDFLVSIGSLNKNGERLDVLHVRGFRFLPKMSRLLNVLALRMTLLPLVFFSSFFYVVKNTPYLVSF